MQLSIIILTHNRSSILLENLQRLSHLRETENLSFEIIVIDSASTDATSERVSETFPEVELITLTENRASPARNLGVHQAKAPVVLFMDDDSYPLPGSMEKAVQAFDRDHQLICLGTSVQLPDGGHDGAAYPLVFPCCAMFVRKDAFQRLDGFPADFKWQAEEYALTFELLSLQGRITRDPNILFFHEKTSIARQNHKTLQNDLKNNLMLCSRYLPSPWRLKFKQDWIERYQHFALAQGLEINLNEVLQELRRHNQHYRAIHRKKGNEAYPWRLSDSNFETFFALQSMTDLIAAWNEKHHPLDVIIAGYSKNLLMVHEACQRLGLKIIGIADDNRALKGQRYRGIPIRSLADSVFMNPDGVLLAEINPARIHLAEAELLEAFQGPVLRLLDAHHQ